MPGCARARSGLRFPAPRGQTKEREQSMSQDDFFSGAGSASARGASDKFMPGVYPAVRIESLKVKEGYHGMRFIAETTVVAEPRERVSGVAPTPVGATGSWNPRIDGKNAKMGLGEVKAFIGVLHGWTPEEVDAMGDDIKPHMYAAIAPDQPFKGKIVATECWLHTTQNNFIMNKHVWSLPAEGVEIVETEAETAETAQPAPPPPPASAAPPAPAAETPETAPGGPWYPIAGDPRGSHYNAQHEFRTF